MAVHVILFFLILLSGLFTMSSKVDTRRKNLYFLRFSFILIFLSQALRGPFVGSDTNRYEAVFYYMHSSGKWVYGSWEPLYLLLNRIVGLFTNNSQWVIIICALLTDIGFYIFIRKYTQHDESTFWPVFFFMVFLHYANSENLVRQYLAMATGVNITWVMRDIKGNKKWIIAAILIITATLFHSMGIIYVLILVPYMLKRITFKEIMLTSLMTIVIIVGFDRFLNLVMRVLPQYSKYLGSRRFESEEFGLFYLSYCLVQLALAVYVYFLNPRLELNHELFIFAYLIVISAGLLALKTRVSIAMRTGYYFSIFLIVYAPAIIRRMKKIKTYAYLFLLVYGIYFFFHTIGSTERGVVPYFFFWQ